jgi:hypothetical protein
MDIKAKKILFNKYWKNGWIDEERRNISADDFKYAKSMGLMFDPVSITHDECIDRILDIVSGMDTDMPAKAFLCSLSSRRLDWRSGIASYYIAKQITKHKYSKAESGYSQEKDEKIYSYTCGICRDQMYGMIGDDIYKKADLNVLNFERIKWGGVRHGDLLYTMFDLERLSSDEIPEPEDEDFDIFRSVLSVIDDCSDNDGPRQLEKKLVMVLKSDKNERDSLIEILACIDIIKPKSTSRKGSMKSDRTFCEFWKGKDGYNKDSVNNIFGKYINIQ